MVLNNASHWRELRWWATIVDDFINVASYHYLEEIEFWAEFIFGPNLSLVRIWYLVRLIASSQNCTKKISFSICWQLSSFNLSNFIAFSIFFADENDNFSFQETSSLWFSRNFSVILTEWTFMELIDYFDSMYLSEPRFYSLYKVSV